LVVQSHRHTGLEKTMIRLTHTAAILALTALHPLVAGPLEITATNKLPLARLNETLSLSAAELAPLGVANLNLVHVKDASGKELLCQAIDLDGDPLRTSDAVIFQADFPAEASLTFTASAGTKQIFRKEQFKAFGRFVRERFDDFAWENDRIAHRTYGHALETWEGEPLSSSTIDIWSKRTPRMVLSDWYLADDYHVDHGEGADFYSAGLSRGCGGGGLWADGKLWVSRNFIRSNVLANGPIRVLFELEYAPFSVNGVSVSEIKRVSLDAGSQFDRIESRYKAFVVPGKSVTLTAAAGIKKVVGEQVSSDKAEGWLAKWEKMEKGAGHQGLALLTRPADLLEHTEDPLNHLVLTKPDASGAAVHWSGFCWNKAGLFTTPEAWTEHVRAFAKGLESPVEIRVTPATN
jgi:Domain of unknown function (DUF4861)